MVAGLREEGTDEMLIRWLCASPFTTDAEAVVLAVACAAKPQHAPDAAASPPQEDSVCGGTTSSRTQRVHRPRRFRPTSGYRPST